jgi:hypothetical protein
MKKEDAWIELDQWLDKYGKVLSFEAKQALIPLRNHLFDLDPNRYNHYRVPLKKEGGDQS